MINLERTRVGYSQAAAKFFSIYFLHIDYLITNW